MVELLWVGFAYRSGAISVDIEAIRIDSRGILLRMRAARDGTRATRHRTRIVPTTRQGFLSAAESFGWASEAFVSTEKSF